MNKICDEGFIWAWTKKAEEHAKELNLEVRKAGTPASVAGKLLNDISRLSWYEKGYVKQIEKI